MNIQPLRYLKRIEAILKVALQYAASFFDSCASKGPCPLKAGAFETGFPGWHFSTRARTVREGLLAKLHLRVHGAGHPMRAEKTPGRNSDDTGHDLVLADNMLRPAVLVADGGYAFDKIREGIERRDALPMIPMRKNRQLCNMVERCFNTLKNSRRLGP